jgi:membrane protein
MNLSKINNFFAVSLWQIKEEEQPYYKIIFFRLCKIIYIIGHSPFIKDIINHGMALSFQVVFSLIPLLALVFSVAKGFGIADKVEPLLLEHTVGGEIAGNLIPKIVEYVNNTNVAALGYTGLAFIIYVAISMISQIESSFNQICSVNRPRTIFRKFSDYLSVLLLAPVLLFLSLGLSTSLSSHVFIHKLLEIGLLAGAMKLFIFSLPWLTSILILTGLYLFIPNTKIRFFPALTAGFFAGIAWQLSQIIFIHFQVGVARYNAIYGTFASVPILMFWIYVSWIIVLSGALICAACQDVRSFHPLARSGLINFRDREKISLLVLSLICRNFVDEKTEAGIKGISAELNLPRDLIAESINGLIKINYIVPAGDDREFYLPARPVEQIRLADFFIDIKKTDGQDFVFPDMPDMAKIDELLARYRNGLEQQFNDETVIILKAGKS